MTSNNCGTDAPGANNSTVPTGEAAVKPMGYFGIKKCGCVVAVVVDDPRYTEHTAERVADYIATGYSVERLPLEENKARLNRCRCTSSPMGETSASPVGVMPRSAQCGEVQGEMS